VNINVNVENLLDKNPDEPVVEYLTLDATIYIDQNLPDITKESLVIHGVTHAYFPFLPETMVEEFGDLLADALRQLRNGNEAH